MVVSWYQISLFAAGCFATSLVLLVVSTIIMYLIHSFLDFQLASWIEYDHRRIITHHSVSVTGEINHML